jgi:hypothetical protein
MPFEVKGDAPLETYVRVRLTKDEKQRLKDDAELAGLTVSEFVRRRAFGKTIMASVDLATIRELRRLGGLFKHVHVTSGGAYSKATAEAIGDVRDFIKKLSAARDR